MKQIERFNLIDKIGRQLQSKMSYTDINVYLSGFGIDCNKSTPAVNSKWIFVKEILADIDELTLAKIADELSIEHNIVTHSVNIDNVSFWRPNTFNLFLSHLASFKKNTYLLKNSLNKYGISSFVAHEDIEPTKEWQIEIEKALFTMDALVAILMPGFKESNWTDQEIGAAIGRDVLIIPIRKGLDPYGFIAKYQGFQAEGKTIEYVAKAIYNILINNVKTKHRMFESLTNQFLLSQDIANAKYYFNLIKEIYNFPIDYLNKIHDNIFNNKILFEDDGLIKNINSLFIEKSLSEIQISDLKKDEDDYEVPF
mgnify:CR=1 FL=1